MLVESFWGPIVVTAGLTLVGLARCGYENDKADRQSAVAAGERQAARESEHELAIRRDERDQIMRDLPVGSPV